MRKEHRANIGKESQRQPAKDFSNQPLRPPYLKGHDQQGNGDDEDDQRDGDKQIDSGGNRADIGSSIDRIGEQQPDRPGRAPRGVVAFQHAGQPSSADHPDFGTQILHDHQSGKVTRAVQRVANPNEAPALV